MEFQAIPEYTAYAGLTRSTEIIEWCGKNLPEGSWWYLGFNHFGFDCEKNQVLFTLRWV